MGRSKARAKAKSRLVVRRHRHDRAGAVLHQHVVGNVDRDALAVDRVGDGAPQRDPGLLAVLGGAVLGRGAGRLVHVVAHRTLLLGPRREALDVGVLGGEHEEGRAEKRVGPRGEDGEVEVQIVLVEDHLGALGAADPVALHGDHMLGPGLEQLEVLEQAVGVVGDLEEPLLELALLDQRAAALAVAVDNLLVGEHGRIHGAPLNRSLLAVGEALLVELQEDPLRPAVVGGFVRADLARPVERDAPSPELLAEGGDRGLGRRARVLAGGDRVVLGGEPEGVVAHRVDHVEAAAAAEVGDGVANRVALQVPDVGFPGGIGEHLEHVVLRLRGVELGGARGWARPRCSRPPRPAASAARSRAGHTAPGLASVASRSRAIGPVYERG